MDCLYFNPYFMTDIEFKNVFNELFPLLWRYSWNITKDKEESEDIALQSMANVWSSLSNFNTVLELKKYAYVTTKNASINHVTKIRSKYKYISQLSEGVQLTEEIEMLTYKAALIERIYEKINSLPSKCRQILNLCYMEGKSRQKVAEELNISIDTVNSQCRIAINKLKIFIT
jgi:RNA polymerase sigma factor (sigma-70 family)